MLVGFAGASCSGKTTLVEAVYKELKEQGYDVAIIKEVARWVFERYFGKFGCLDVLRSDKDVYYRFQKKIFDEQLFLENELERQYDIVLTDRTIFDNLLYTVTYCDITQIFRLFRTLPPIGKKRYDLIFLCEPLKSADCGDGFRSQKDIELQRFHTLLLYNWIVDWDNVVVLTQGMDLRERVHHAVDTIRKRGFRTGVVPQ